MEPANSVILGFCLMKIMPSLPCRSLPVRAETPGTMAPVIKRLAWSKASVILAQMASGRQRQLRLTGVLKMPTPLPAPLCGVQRQAVFFLSFGLGKLFSILCFSPMHFFHFLPSSALDVSWKEYCLVLKNLPFEPNFCLDDQSLCE